MVARAARRAGEDRRSMSTMRFRVKPILNVPDSSLGWLKDHPDYEADWTPGWPRDPRHVRLYSPSDRTLFADVPITYLERVL